MTYEMTQNRVTVMVTVAGGNVRRLLTLPVNLNASQQIGSVFQNTFDKRF